MDKGHHRSRVAAKERVGSLSRIGASIAVVLLLALSLAACAHAEASLSPSPSGNVSGTVLLKGAQADAPGSGLLVTALSRKPHVRPVSTHTAADGSFQLQLQPGWYLLTVDYWGAPAAQIHVGDSSITVAPIAAPSRELAQTTRVTVNVAPGVIPPPGVWLGSHRVLLQAPRPLLKVPRHLPATVVISRKRAIAVALGRGQPARAVLALVFAPERILNGKTPMRNWLTWVVTRTMSKPLDPRIGGPPLPGATPGPPYLVHHSVSFVDARTGEFLLGFFTP
jgi:hypothetical protein